MKGIELLSDLFSVFMLIIIIIIMVGLIWIFTEIKFVAYGTGLVKARDVTIRILFNPVKYDSVLLTFLELRPQGIPMKKILNAAAIQNTTRPWMPETSSFVNAAQISYDILSQQLLTGKSYLLKIRNPEIVIAQSGNSYDWQKTSTELFLLNGKPVDLELYVG
jgi:hypothetical protein